MTRPPVAIPPPKPTIPYGPLFFLISMATWLKVPSAVTVAEEQNSSCGHRCKLFSETLTSLDLFQILGCCCFSLQICSGLTGERSSIAIHLKRSFRPEFHEFSESKIRWSSKTRSLLCRLLCIYIYTYSISHFLKSKS